MVTASCPDRQTLARYSVGKLPDEQSEELAGHVDSCPDCQETLLALDSSDDTLLGQLRTSAGDPLLAEPQCEAALAAAIGDCPDLRTAGHRPEVGQGPSLSADEVSFPPTIGEYEILEELGRGGMGRVYKAMHTKLGRTVALKVLTRGRGNDPQAIGRFAREMLAVGRVDHPNIVRAYDAREIDDTPVLVMELIDGLDLSEIVRRTGPLAVADACELVRQTAAALQCAHEHGLVHRDVKPSNLMLTRAGEVKLLDLGLARFCMFVVPPSGGKSPAEAGTTNADEITGSGLAMGTADYMAPEQASDSRSVDIRADLYSLGCTLYKLLTGRAPFSGPGHRGTFEKMTAHVHETPPAIRTLAADVPQALAAILDRLLAKDPADRFATPGDLAEAIEPFTGGADLVGLIERALTAGPRGTGRDEAAADGSVALIPPSPATCRRPVLTRLLIGLAILGALAAGFAAGILITIKKDGETYHLTAPPGSHTSADAEGNVVMDLAGPAGPPRQEATTLSEAVRVFNARAKDDPVGGKQPPLTEEAIVAAIRWALLDPDELPVSDKTLEVLEEIADTRRLPPGYELEVLTRFEPTDRMEFTKWSVRLRIPAEPSGTTCISVREVMVGSRLFGEHERRVIEKWRKKWREQGGIGGFELESYRRERENAAEMDGVTTEPAKRLVGTTGPAINPTAALKALEGRWAVVGIEKGDAADEAWARILTYAPGSKVPPAADRFDFKSGTLTILDFEKATTLQFPFGIDPTADPPTIDFFTEQRFAGPGLDSTELLAVGVYRIEGDRLKVCLRRYEPVLKVSQRPAQVAVAPDSGDILFTLERKQPSADVKALEGIGWGRWNVVGQIDDGEPLPEEMLRDRWYTFARSQFYVLELKPDGSLATEVAGLFELDSTKLPKEISIYASAIGGQLARQDLPGIYKLDGDRMTIAYRKGGPRPEKFESAAGSGVTLVVLRQADGPQETSVSADVPDDVAIQGEWAVVSMVGVPLDKSVTSATAPEEVHETTKVKITADTLDMVGPLVAPFSATYQLNPAEDPKRIDLRVDGALCLGIYELEGERLTICAERPKKERDRHSEHTRPAEFMAVGTGRMKLVLKRIGDADAGEGAANAETSQSPAVTPAADFDALQGPWKIVHAETTESMEYRRRIERLDFRGGSLWMTYSKSSARESFKYRIDPAEAPQQIDLSSVARTASESPSYFGIYELDGDRLKLSLVWNNPAVKSVQRPGRFDLDVADVVWELERLPLREDEKALEGRWPVASQTVDGKAMPDKKLRNKMFHFRGNTFNADLAYEDLDVTLDLSGTYVLDPAETPEAITFYARSDPPDVPAWEAELPAIYKLDGDRLSIAYRKGGPRPESFEATPGSGVTLVVMEKERRVIGAEFEVPGNVDEWRPSDAAESPTTPAVDPAADLKTLEGEWIVTAATNDGSGTTVAGIDVSTHLVFGEKSLRIFGLDEGCAREWGYRIDPRAAPKTIDLLRSRGGRFEDSGTLGIYEIDGDRLTIRLTQSPSTLTPRRPKSLEGGPGSSEVLLTLARHQSTDDERAIEGDWTIVEYVKDGEPVPAEQPSDGRFSARNRRHSYYSRERYLRFADHRVHFMNHDHGDELALSFQAKSGFCVLDPASTPKAITFTLSPIKCALGIYELDGDRMRIAYCAPDPFGRHDATRPESFETAPESDVTLLELKRRPPAESNTGAIDPADP